MQHVGVFLSRTPLRILRTGSGIDPGTAFGRPLAGATKGACRSLPRKATRPSYITNASHLSPATYLNGQHRPFPISRAPSSSVCLLSCLVLLLFSCVWSFLLLPAGPFNDTQDDRPPHPHLRPLRLCRTQLKAPSTSDTRQCLPPPFPAGTDNALPKQSTYLISSLALSTALRLVSLSGSDYNHPFRLSSQSHCSYLPE